MSLLPAYMSELWRCYEQMSREDLQSFDIGLVSVEPESCHSSVLPFLAWECDADISGLDDRAARAVIRAAFDAMQYSGTAKALISNVEALSESVKVYEWFEYGGDAYNFRVEIDSSQNGLSSELITKLENTARKQKNVRSNLESIKISMRSTGEMNNLTAVTSGESAVVYPYFPDPIEVSAAQVMGAAYHDVDTTIIYPQGA
ncbi:tail protein I [Sulfurimonas phage SNW-1]|nr:tail protein I [Sulfurimonas phage SNW-1]